MQQLLQFLYRFRTFGLFLLLEAICVWLIISYNNRQNAAFLNSSNAFVASVNTFSSNATDYFNLTQVNDQLIKENRQLREALANVNQHKVYSDTVRNKFDFVEARVINNTFRRSMNYLTLDVGALDGVTPGMGVISSEGVVGQVKSVSDHFATATSLLHRKLMVSSSVGRTGTLCTAQWDAEKATEISIKFIPRHIPLMVGDTIVTSGYNAVFPAGIMIGKIKEFELADNDVFYQAKADLSVDFSSLSYVYLIQNKLKAEQDSLEQNTVEIR